VVTAPDKPAGRGMQLQSSDVKNYALQQGLPILQPEKLKDPFFLEQLKALEADVQIVVAFRMLPEVVWNMPPMGTINLHASLLPDYRGAAPINWAIINGETETGISTFKLKHQIDTGNILLQQKVTIEPNDNVGSLYQKLMNLGGSLLFNTLQGLVMGTLNEKEQVEPLLVKHAPKIFKQNCEIDFSKSALEVHNFIRGLSPYPAAYTKIINGISIKIFDANYSLENWDFNNTNYYTDNKSLLYIKCSQGYLKVLTLQQEAKKKMPIEVFLMGNKL
jgi:methionyl-tRNA formyltransferase